MRALSPSPATLILTRLSLFGELLFPVMMVMVMMAIIDERLSLFGKLLFYSDDGDDGDGDDNDEIL